MRKMRKQLTIIVTACMLVLFAGSAFALTAGQFGGALVPGGVTVTISDVGLTPVFSPGDPAPHMAVHNARVVGSQFIVDFDVYFTAPGQYIVAEFLVRNHTPQVLTITDVITNHAADNPFGIVVTQWGPMSAQGVNVVPAAPGYGSISMKVLWDEAAIDWDYIEYHTGYRHRIDGIFDFSTIIRFDQTTPTPTPTDDNGGGGNGGGNGSTPTPTPGNGDDNDDEPDLPPVDAPPTNGDEDDDADDDDNDYTDDYNDDDADDENNDEDSSVGIADGSENPQTGDFFNSAWFVVSLVGFCVSAAVLTYLVIAKKNSNE